MTNERVEYTVWVEEDPETKEFTIGVDGPGEEDCDTAVKQLGFTASQVFLLSLEQVMKDIGSSTGGEDDE